MNKCEWKNGEFDPCDAMGFTLHHNLITYKMDRHKIEISGISTPLRYCPCCGAYIRKPKPQVIIKRSGETWVKREGGIDYLWMESPYSTKPTLYGPWKPISEIEITDEVGRLRCLVRISSDNEIYSLWGVYQGSAFVTIENDDKPYHVRVEDIRIANVDDIG